MNEKILPGFFQLAPALRTLHQGCIGLCSSRGTRPHCPLPGLRKSSAHIQLSCSMLWVLLCQFLELGTALPEDPSVLPRAIEW